MNEAVFEDLEFAGYILEDNYNEIPEIKGVYCAYACSKNPQTNKWTLGDIVYFGKAEEGDSSIRARVIAHMNKDDNARKTLRKGEKLAYAYAKTDNASVCERALIAEHKDLPRLANDKLTGEYEGPMVFLTTSGKNKGISEEILFLSNEKE